MAAKQRSGKRGGPAARACRREGRLGGIWQRRVSLGEPLDVSQMARVTLDLLTRTRQRVGAAPSDA